MFSIPVAETIKGIPQMLSARQFISILSTFRQIYNVDFDFVQDEDSVSLIDFV